jgi:hypothetical protein
MSFNDVQYLKAVETGGEEIMSWHSKALWNKCKGYVVDEETALRLSKLLRDNRHTVMNILKRLYEERHHTFLATYLELDYANYDVTFVNLRVENYKTRFDKLVRTHRGTLYASEQAARRCRVAFQSLVEYFQKQTRNTFIISTDEIEGQVALALNELDKSPATIFALDKRIGDLLEDINDDHVDNEFRKIVSSIPSKALEPENFIKAKSYLNEAMRLVAEELSHLWNDDRYVRATENSNEDPI